MVKIPDPYGRSIKDGKPLDNATIAALEQAEDILGYDLSIAQGIGGAKASGGTHLAGRAVDLAPYDYKRKVRVLRDLGFAAWYRPAVAGLWPAHVHAVLIFENRANRRGIAPAGFDQIGKYDRDEDGLANPPTPDPNPYRPTPRRVFTLADYRATFQPPPPRIVTANMTFQLNGDRGALLALAATADILCLVECRTKDNKPLDVAAVLGDQWDVRQDLTLAARAGSVLAVRKSAAKVRRSRLGLLSNAGNGVQTRYQRISTVRLPGKTVRVIVSHPPVPAENHREAAANTRTAIGAARRWRKVLRRERVWLWAGDCNTEPAAWAKTLGAPHYSGDKPMCICWSAGWGAMDTSKRDVAGLDHTVITVTKE